MHLSAEDESTQAAVRNHGGAAVQYASADRESAHSSLFHLEVVFRTGLRPTNREGGIGTVKSALVPPTQVSSHAVRRTSFRRRPRENVTIIAVSLYFCFSQADATLPGRRCLCVYYAVELYALLPFYAGASPPYTFAGISVVVTPIGERRKKALARRVMKAFIFIRAFGGSRCEIRSLRENC